MVFWTKARVRLWTSMCTHIQTAWWLSGQHRHLAARRSELHLGRVGQFLHISEQISSNIIRPFPKLQKRVCSIPFPLIMSTLLFCISTKGFYANAVETCMFVIMSRDNFQNRLWAAAKCAQWLTQTWTRSTGWRQDAKTLTQHPSPNNRVIISAAKYFKCHITPITAQHPECEPRVLAGSQIFCTSDWNSHEVFLSDFTFSPSVRCCSVRVCVHKHIVSIYSRL